MEIQRQCFLDREDKNLNVVMTSPIVQAVTDGQGLTCKVIWHFVSLHISFR